MKDFSLKVGIFILPRPPKISHLFSSLHTKEKYNVSSLVSFSLLREVGGASVEKRGPRELGHPYPVVKAESNPFVLLDIFLSDFHVGLLFV